MESSAWMFLNQTARGFGLLGRSGIIAKPANPQTTVMMALITNNQRQPASPLRPSRVLVMAAWSAPDIICPTAWQEW